MRFLKRWLLCFILVLSMAASACAAPMRIVSMSPAATEILFALSLGDRLIGVTRFCDYPPEVARIPRVASLLDINLETLLTLAPDLVVLVDLNETLKERIERLGIATFTLRQETLEELCDSIEGLASVCGVADRGRALAGSMRADFDRIGALTASLPHPRVLVAVDRDISDPVIRSLYVAGQESFYNELIRLAGGRNAFEAGGVTYPKLTPEGLLGLDPDVVIDIVGDHGLREGVDLDAVRNQWNSLPDLKAVRENRICLLSGNTALHPGPRLVRVLEDFVRFIHPEISGDVGPLTSPTPNPSLSMNGEGGEHK